MVKSEALKTSSKVWPNYACSLDCTHSFHTFLFMVNIFFIFEKSIFYIFLAHSICCTTLELWMFTNTGYCTYFLLPAIKEIFYKLYYLHTSSNKHTHTNQMIVWFIPLPCSFITNPFEYKYSSTVKWFTTWSNIWAKIQFSDTDWTGLCSSRIVCKYFYLLHLLWIMF